MSTLVHGSACRTCCKRERTKYLHVDAIDQNGLQISDMIYQITDIMVTLDSHLPQQICQSCLKELRLAHNFRQKCINSNTTLSKQMSKTIESLPVVSDPQLALVVKEEHYDPDMEAEEQCLSDTVEHEVEKPKEISQQVGDNFNITSSMNNSVSNRKRKGTIISIANKNVRIVNQTYACALNDGIDCLYVQKKYDPNNMVRHFRMRHKQTARELGLLIDTEDDEKPEKKARIIPKQVVEIDVKQLIEASIKLVIFHNLPLECFEWDAFLDIYNPLTKPMGLVVNRTGIARCIRSSVGRIHSRIRGEMNAKLLSILIDSAIRRGQHVMTVSSQFSIDNVVETRVLGTIWVKAGQTAKLLKCRVEQILNKYEIRSSQVFAVIVENGSNTITSAKKLHRTFRETAWGNVGEDTDGNEIDKLDELLEALSAELRDQFNVMRGPIRNLHLALNDVLLDTDPNMFRLSRFARDLRDIKYDDMFKGNEKLYPPLCIGNQWIAKYKLIRGILKKKEFFLLLAEKHPEISLQENEWQYMQEFNEAFQPLYDITKRVQKKHHPFSEFYMQWLLAIKDLRNKTNNRFSKPLTESLTKRVTVLRENLAFKACMYLDPRFNYCESVVFTLEQRDEMKNYIVSIWNRIQNLRPGMGSDKLKSAEIKQEDNKDDMDDFLTEMFGGPSERSSKPLPVPFTSSVTPILHQLKSLEIEPRQAQTFDVWQHWLHRAGSHPELFSVAMVVLSLPSNNVNLERAFSALVLSDRRDGLTEKNLEELLLVRLNRSLFEKIVLSIGDWKQILGS